MGEKDAPGMVPRFTKELYDRIEQRTAAEVGRLWPGEEGLAKLWGYSPHVPSRLWPGEEGTADHVPYMQEKALVSVELRM